MRFTAEGGTESARIISVSEVGSQVIVENGTQIFHPSTTVFVRFSLGGLRVSTGD